MSNQIIHNIKSRANKRLYKLFRFHGKNLTYKDYLNVKKIFKDEYLYFSSYEFLISEKKSKQTGIRYFPEYIAYFMIDITIKKWLLNPQNDIKNIKILDPFCGSGIFTQLLIEYLLIEFTPIFPNKTKKELLDLIINKHIFSWDYIQESINVCKTRILTTFNIQPNNVETKNTLLDLNFFDIIIGNLPYGDLLFNELKNDINSLNDNIGLDYINWGIQQLHDNGEICFISPTDISENKSYANWRKNIFNLKSLHTVIKLEDENANKKIILGFNKEKNYTINIANFNNNYNQKDISIDELYNVKNYYEIN